MKIDVQSLKAALEEIELKKGISQDTALRALKEAMIRSYRRDLGGDDADVRVDIDLEKGEIEMYQVKVVRKEVEDDFFEISIADADKIEKKKHKDGDEICIYACLTDLRKATALSIKSAMKQKFVEAEKSILYETFKDKINTMITGVVEKMDDRGATINIGKTSVFLPQKQMIGEERFKTGERIRLYVSNVSDTAKKGASQVTVSRANEGFLQCLFNEEIREIEDGTIQIVAIAREAGERSKVAVTSANPDVDPAGACIGNNGVRIQKIVSQLGNNANKEKVDVINYSPNIGLYVLEALKPARTVGVIIDELERKAIAIVADDSLSLAIGKKGVNVRLAAKLTDMHVDIKKESDALAENLEFTSIEELQVQEEERKHQEALQRAVKPAVSIDQVISGYPEGYVPPQERVYEEESNDVDEVLSNQVEEEVLSKPAEEPVVEQQDKAVEKAAPVEEEKEEIKNVKITTTLSSLESSLNKSEDKNKEQKKTSNKKKQKEEVEEKKTTKTVSQYMPIYSEEELAEIEAEEAEEDDVYDGDDVDYDEYDEYYDE